jgi:hypothetical protein
MEPRIRGFFRTLEDALVPSRLYMNGLGPLSRTSLSECR